MARALRIRTANATGSVAISAIDAATQLECCAIYSGEVIRALRSTGDIVNAWLLGNGGATTGGVKAVFRIAEQSNGTAHFQFRYYPIQNTHVLSYDLDNFKAWNLYAFYAGRNNTNRFIQVAEYDLITGTASFLTGLNPTPTTSPGAIQSVSGSELYLNHAVGEDQGLGSAAATRTWAGSDIVGQYLRLDAKVTGPAATAAELFVRPDDADVDVVWGFTDGAGSSTVADSAGGHDVTLGGTELTDYVWVGENAAYDLDDNTAPAGAYTKSFTGDSDTAVAFRNGRAEGHASDKNTAHNEDPEWGFGGASGAGGVNVKTDSWRWLSSMEDIPTGWDTSTNQNSGDGGNTNAVRDDLAATGQQGTLNWLLSPQFVAGTSQAQLYCQRKYSGGTVGASFGTVSVDASAEPVLHEVWGAGSGYVQVRSSDPGGNDWHVLYDSATQGETANFAALPSSLGWRWQSKNRTNSTSAFAGSNVTWCDSVGSVLVGLWSPSAPAQQAPICPHTGLACQVGLGFTGMAA